MGKLKGELGTNLPSLTRTKLTQLIEEAVADAYTEEEQAAAFLAGEHLALPFPVKILGVDAGVEKVSTTLDGQILPFAVEAKRGRRSRSWTCRCQRRLRQAWKGLPLIATGDPTSIGYRISAATSRTLLRLRSTVLTGLADGYFFQPDTVPRPSLTIFRLR
jgi:hypothetical protein